MRLGVPSLNVPCGFAANGLPVSFQVVARPFNEAVLFTVAHSYQGVTDWHRHHRPEPLRCPPPAIVGGAGAKALTHMQHWLGVLPSQRVEVLCSSKGRLTDRHGDHAA